MRILTRARIGLLIFAVSAIVRIALVLAGGAYRQPVNPIEPVLIARSLDAGQGFSNPYGCVTGPTTHLAPVFPFLLSVVYRLFPPGSSRELAVYILSLTLISLAYALLPWLAVKLRLDRRVGVIAGFVGAVFPLFFWMEVTAEWEMPLSALLLTLTLGMFAGLFAELTIRRAVITGIVCGVTLMTLPTLLPTFGVISLLLIWQRRERLAETLVPTGALWLAAGLLIMPWTIRNYLTFHEFIMIRGNTGLELHVSFNDRSRPTFEESDLNGALVDHPHSNLRACAEFAQFGETTMNHKYQQEAVKWILAHPRRTVVLVLEHFAAFWRFALPSPIKSVASGVLTLLGLVGLGLCFRRNQFAFRLLGIVMLTYPFAYYVSKFDMRYRYPIHAIILLLASLFLTEAVKGLSRRNVAREEPE